MSAYFIFGEKTVKLKNIVLNDACNVGVNCAQPASSSECGALRMANPTDVDGSQWAGDFVDFNIAGGSIWQLFNNSGNTANVTIRHDHDTFTPPILADLNGNGSSCTTSAGQCLPDYDDLYRACGFPAVFPACGGQLVIAQSGVDCIPNTVENAGDIGNGRCDLPSGTYSGLVLQNNAKVQLVGGGTNQYQFCSITTGKNTDVQATVPVILNVADGGAIRIDNGSKFGRLCGDITVFKKGVGDITFSHDTTIVTRLCAPEADIQLGHANDLTGQFVGNTVLGDLGNKGHCCTTGGSCTCFDEFSPTTAHVGNTVTLTGKCDLTLVTAVSLTCGANNFAAVIGTKTSASLQFTVPAGASGACTINVTSLAGVFSGTGTLTIN